MKKLLFLAMVFVMSIAIVAAQIDNAPIASIYSVSACVNVELPPYRFEIETHDGHVFKCQEVHAKTDTNAQIVFYVSGKNCVTRRELELPYYLIKRITNLEKQ